MWIKASPLVTPKTGISFKAHEACVLLWFLALAPICKLH